MMIVRYKTYDRQGTMQLYEEWLRSGEEKIAVGDDFWFYLIKSYCDDPVNVDVAALLLEDAIRENAMVRRKRSQYGRSILLFKRARKIDAQRSR